MTTGRLQEIVCQHHQLRALAAARAGHAHIAVKCTAAAAGNPSSRTANMRLRARFFGF
jgi:hypothetical protein